MHCLVQGRVQGVWFRASCRDQAQRLGLRGRAVNRADGSVEVWAYGPPEALQALRSWLQQGPPQAEVTALRCEAVAEDPTSRGFTTG
jgi:acylphosphatase